MKKTPFYQTKKDLRPPFNKALQHQLTTLFHQYNVRLIPCNFRDYFGVSPTLASDFIKLSYELNPHRLNKNCYYCTIAALTNQNVLDMVAETETMQQDTATLDELMSLFNEAGVSAAMRCFDDHTLPAQQLWEQTYCYIDRILAEFEAVGLAYNRQPIVGQNGLFHPSSGHMVVVAKDDNGVIAKLDYQSGHLELLSSKHPPEGAYHQSYNLFQQYAVQIAHVWQEAYDFIVSQYLKNISWRGVLITQENNQEKIHIYHMPKKNRIIAEVNKQVVNLNKYNDPRGIATNSPIMICTVT